jgi:hypothetical protein
LLELIVKWIYCLIDGVFGHPDLGSTLVISDLISGLSVYRSKLRNGILRYTQSWPGLVILLSVSDCNAIGVRINAVGVGVNAVGV